MRTIYIIIFLSITQLSFSQDTLSLKGTTYNRFLYHSNVLKFKDLGFIVSPQPAALKVYNECLKTRKTAKVVENLAFVSIGFGLLKLISIPAQSTKFFVLGGAIGLVSIPLKIKSKKKIDNLITVFNNSHN